ncbi:DNA-binding LacI/PurR family transcriptional regulator [Saccharothrix ecbatanensis]|uniref:DNA-binding LacI/PurR family transcriptional regulator n=1 Tax=Saccharothrix ecbatanensis TaxID=1105145 RepID=A0A7W9HKR7_9PSEU|nr:LacI family DNA-binding transcriptional regulator [Saccharothrix ecbatanensis]MBB5804112.1 DNA-binding LacI/PurR family transcriptional regulator [Saccharothrix ecbatanensis]
MVTIADVARHAGVAPSTVSYVLTGRRSISSATKARVEASVRALGYHPHAGARSLASNRANVLALVLPMREGMHMPVLMQFVVAVANAARRHEHDVLLVTADQGAAGLRRVAGSAQVDGLLVMDVEMHDERVPVLRELDRPSVLIGFPADAAGLTCVDLDFAEAGSRCVDHLADLGHRYVALVGAPRAVYQRDTGFAHRTMAGFSAAAMRRDVSSTTLPTDTDHESVRVAITGLLERHPSVTALVVHNEAALPSVVEVLRSSGRKVPDDIAVIAICPDDQADRLMPPLTSVAVPAEQLGQHAVALLMAKLDRIPTPPLTLLPPRLTERTSTAPR